MGGKHHPLSENGDFSTTEHLVDLKSACKLWSWVYPLWTSSKRPECSSTSICGSPTKLKNPFLNKNFFFDDFGKITIHLSYLVLHYLPSTQIWTRIILEICFFTTLVSPLFLFWGALLIQNMTVHNLNTTYSLLTFSTSLHISKSKFGPNRIIS